MQVWVIGLGVAECVWGWAVLPLPGRCDPPPPPQSQSEPVLLGFCPNMGAQGGAAAAPRWVLGAPGAARGPDSAPESQPRGSHGCTGIPHHSQNIQLPPQGCPARERLGISEQWLHHPSPSRGDNSETDGSLSIKTSFIRKVKKPPDTIA